MGYFAYSKIDRILEGMMVRDVRSAAGGSRDEKYDCVA